MVAVMTLLKNEQQDIADCSDSRGAYLFISW